MKKLLIASIYGLLFAFSGFAQIPTAVLARIVRAEDELRYDKSIEYLLKHTDERVRIRAALVAGRIGDAAAIPALTAFIEKERSSDAKAMGVFAIGEIESIKAADLMLKILQDAKTSDSVRARAVEAAGKLAAANANDPKAKELGESVLNVLTAEEKRSGPSADVIRLGLTAALRARPAGAEDIVRKFLAFTDPNIVADALNTLARLRAKNANRDARDLLETHLHAVVRANAARVLGASEDKEAVDVLLKAATTDADSRVRVSAIRALGSLKDPIAAERLMTHGEKLLSAARGSKSGRPNEQSEMIEIAVALGRILADTRNARAVNFIREFGKIDDGHSTEVYLARLHIAPGRGDDKKDGDLTHWRQYSTLAQLAGEFASLEPTTDEARQMKGEAPDMTRQLVDAYLTADPKIEADEMLAASDAIRAFAKFKTEDLTEVLRKALTNDDVFIRATSAELLGEESASKENTGALKSAFAKSLETDKHDNDAQLAILSALVKLNKGEAADSLRLALGAADYLVRRHAANLIRENGLKSEFPGFESKAGPVRKYDPKSGTKLGQVLNTEADYRRAVARRNGSVNAILTTEKGTFTIDLLPDDAPLTVDNFIKLARANYFNGLEVHRVVPNFVMQDGDPRGDGNGGPGWSIRDEINIVPYTRGAVGMALSGKNTGGSQWFVTHSPQPHLDGGYTVFGKVSEADMKVVDMIVRGDRILNVKIIEGNFTRRTWRAR